MTFETTSSPWPGLEHLPHAQVRQVLLDAGVEECLAGQINLTIPQRHGFHLIWNQKDNFIEILFYAATPPEQLALAQRALTEHYGPDEVHATRTSDGQTLIVLRGGWVQTRERLDTPQPADLLIDQPFEFLDLSIRSDEQAEQDLALRILEQMDQVPGAWSDVDRDDLEFLADKRSDDTIQQRDECYVQILDEARYTDPVNGHRWRFELNTYSGSLQLVPEEWEGDDE